MTNLKKQIFSAMTAGALLLNVATPALAGTTLEISGNGSDSDNTVDVSTSNNTAVVQNNEAHVNNNIKVESNTGENTADDNTGGDVEIETGDADTEVNVSNSLNSNQASVDCCNEGDTEVKISGNGSDSDNEIDLNLDNSTVVTQENDAKIGNEVDVDSDTGDNSADDNTGGDVVIETGDADAEVNIDNMVNFNAADVDCGCVLDLTAKIAGNGTESDNKIKADVEGGSEVFQDNAICLDNSGDVDADTGDNDAEDNTGSVDSDPSITTGDADTNVSVENSGNANSYGDNVDSDWPSFDFDFSFDFDLSDLLAALGM